MTAVARSLSVVLETAHGPLEPRLVRLEEGLGEVGAASVEVVTGADADTTSWLDGDVTLTWLRDGDPRRSHALRVAEVTWLGAPGGLPRWRLRLHPALWFQGLTLDVRKFRDRSVRSIVTAVLDEAGVAHRWELSVDLPARPYVVQYRESRLDFVRRLLEHEGIHFVFDDDGTLVLRDRSDAAPGVPGRDVFRLIDAAGALAHAEEGLTTFAQGCRVGPGRVTVGDHDWKAPERSLRATAVGRRDADLEIYACAEGYRDREWGQRLAQLRLEAHESTKIFATGTSTVLAFAPGRRFALAHEDGVVHDGEWVLRRVVHDYRWDPDAESGTSYANTFEAIRAEAPFRPLPLTPRPRVSGTHSAMVRGPLGEEIHTDRWGRAKVQLHWDREARGLDDSRWMRVLQETSSSMQLARVGWEVAVGYVGGDPERPIALSRQINGHMIPTYAQPEQRNVCTIKTETYPGKVGSNEIRLDDSASRQQIFVHAEERLINHVRNDQREAIGNDEQHRVTIDRVRKVGRSQSLTVGGDETARVATTDRSSIGGDRTLSIGAVDAIAVASGLVAQIGADDHEAVGSVRASLVGGVALAAVARSALPTPGALAAPSPPKPPPLGALLQGNITRASRRDFARTVGGAQVSLAGGPFLHRGNAAIVETSGGLKMIASAKDSVTESAQRALVRTVGGAHLVKAGTDVTVSADHSAVTVGGGVSATATTTIELKGDRLLLEAKDLLSLDVGGARLELTPSGVTLVGKVGLKADDAIEVHGKPDDLTK